MYQASCQPAAAAREVACILHNVVEDHKGRNMSSHHTARIFVLCAALVAGASSTACNRGEDKAAPVAQIQTQTPQAGTNAPMTVTGCLRAGEAPGTFVLTTTTGSAGEQAATYQLAGREGVDLRSQVGSQIEITGVMTSQQEIASRTPAAPAAGEKATGTSGTPTVATSTEVAIKQLQVQTVRRVADKCEG